MRFRTRIVGCSSCVWLLAAAACSTSGPSSPTSSLGGGQPPSPVASPSPEPSSAAPAGADSADDLFSLMRTGSIAAPRPVSPSTNSTVRNQDQPVTLVARNAVVTKRGDTTYTFEVATDLGFVSKVQTKDAVPEGSGGTTAVRLDTLAPATDYYWHVRAQGAGTTGVFGRVFKFTVGPAITINAPVPIAPLTGAQTTQRPALRVANAVRTGPAGLLTYRFEISTVSTFASLLISGVSSEGVNETAFVPTELPSSVILFWRAIAIDVANGIASPPSAVQSFTANAPSQAEILAIQIGKPLWPGAVPPGSIGHATMGEAGPFGVGWQVQTLYYAPGNVTFQSPDIEMLRIFDLLDRGFDPDGAAAWMNQNGYPTSALWYPPPEKAVIGLKYVYLAARGKQPVNGIWDVVLRVE